MNPNVRWEAKQKLHTEIVSGYEAGLSMREVANAIGMSIAQVSVILKKRGIPLRPRGNAVVTIERIQRIADKRHRAMAKMRSNGLTLQAIGDAFGVTKERVRQILMQFARPR